MKRFFWIGILAFVLVFATSYRTETYGSPSTGGVDASASAYWFAYRNEDNDLRVYGSVSVSMYATSMGYDTPNGGGFVYHMVCDSYDSSSVHLDFIDGISWSNSYSTESDAGFHCEARATVWADYGGYDHDVDADRSPLCRRCP